MYNAVNEHISHDLNNHVLQYTWAWLVTLNSCSAVCVKIVVTLVVRSPLLSIMILLGVTIRPGAPFPQPSYSSVLLPP